MKNPGRAFQVSANAFENPMGAVSDVIELYPSGKGLYLGFWIILDLSKMSNTTTISYFAAKRFRK